ncbi:calvin cycle protein CP12-2, chloroplastic-like protein [Tanacetum coccineum]
MATISSASLSIPRVLANPSSDSPKILKPTCLKMYNTTPMRSGRMFLRPVMAAPDSLSEKIAESIEHAKETCAEDPVSGECAASWDEVEELSAAASHAKDKKKQQDPLETYCADNPETDECRMHDN